MKAKSIAIMLLFCMAVAVSAFASKDVPVMPRTLANSRFVYVTSYDGDQYNPNLLPEDRAAISRVQESIQKWGKLTLVYRAQDADMIVVVQSRPSEDVLAVYDATGFPQTYRWRVMSRAGLQKGETPLISQFKQAFEKIAN